MQTRSRVVIGHHLDAAQAAALAQALPEGIELRSLLMPGRGAWDLPHDVEVVVTQPADMWPEALRGGQRQPSAWPGPLRWVHLRSTGLDRYPPWVLAAPLVTNSSGAQAVSISEYVLSAMLAHEKQRDRIRIRDPLHWHATRAAILETPLGGLEGKVLGLVGLGNIGKAMARLAQAFGMQVAAARRSAAAEGCAGVDVLPLQEVVRRADHLLIAVPLDASTRGLIDARLLSECRRGVHLINVARGAVVDTDALVSALEDGRVGGATLDVTEPEPLPEGHPLYTHPRVTLTPHIAYSGPSTERHSIRLFCENLRRYLQGEPLHQRVFTDGMRDASHAQQPSHHHRAGHAGDGGGALDRLPPQAGAR